jgi:hypothetical protein
MKEIWKKIEYKNVPDIYEVSSLGGVKRVAYSLDAPNQFGVFQTTRKEKGMRSCRNTYGYSMLRIQVGNKKQVHLIHRLVATAFIPNPENKPCVNHKDLNKSNNCVDNLEWVTYRENSLHATENGVLISYKGRESNLTKYTEEQVREVYKLCKTGVSQYKAGIVVGMPRPTVASIIQKVSWRHITDLIDIEIH